MVIIKCILLVKLHTCYLLHALTQGVRSESESYSKVLEKSRIKGKICKECACAENPVNPTGH